MADKCHFLDTIFTNSLDYQLLIFLMQNKKARRSNLTFYVMIFINTMILFIAD